MSDIFFQISQIIFLKKHYSYDKKLTEMKYMYIYNLSGPVMQSPMDPSLNIFIQNVLGS